MLLPVIRGSHPPVFWPLFFFGGKPSIPIPPAWLWWVEVVVPSQHACGRIKDTFRAGPRPEVHLTVRPHTKPREPPVRLLETRKAPLRPPIWVETSQGYRKCLNYVVIGAYGEDQSGPVWELKTVEGLLLLGEVKFWAEMEQRRQAQ